MGHNSSKPVNLKKSIRKSASNLSSQNASSSSDDEADGDLNCQQQSQKKRGSKKGKMPLFRKQSTNAKKRQDHQQYLVCRDSFSIHFTAELRLCPQAQNRYIFP
jgi:hypothetical protein